MNNKRKRLTLAPLIRENVNVALGSIRSNRLRSILTIAMIAVGIMSLVGILTATEVLRSYVTESFGKMGATSFYIQSTYSDLTRGGERRRVKNRRTITYPQTVQFAQNYDYPSLITVYTTALRGQIAKYNSEQTEPTTTVFAVDENYINFNKSEIAEGRDFNTRDMENATAVCVIGGSIAGKLFKTTNPIGEILAVGPYRFTIIGVLKSMGDTFGGSMDGRILIPLSNARATILNDNSNYTIGIQCLEIEHYQTAVDEAEKIFRSVRRLSPYDVTDFRINRSDSVLDELNEQLSYIKIAAAVIGFITLLGAAVGLMNIMLVAVKERTREIGTRKALGATSKLIKQQFLIESIVIGQLGGLFGMILGILTGNVMALSMKTTPVIPWLWMFVAILVCLGVSMMSGYIPAVRASNLDPIEALRYE